LASILSVESMKYRSAPDFADQCSIFFVPVPTTLELLTASEMEMSLLHSLRVAASTLCLAPESSWTEDVHHAQLSALETPPDKTVESLAWKRALYHYLRWALLGGQKGPGIAKTLEILGRHASVGRIQAANLRARELEMSNSKPMIRASGFKGDGDGHRRIEKEWKGYSL